MGHVCSRVLGDREWTQPGGRVAACDAWVFGLHTARVGRCTSARLCRDQGKGRRASSPITWMIMGSRVVEMARRRCRSERGVENLARTSNELDVEMVQTAAFTCDRKIGSPAQKLCHVDGKPSRAALRGTVCSTSARWFSNTSHKVTFQAAQADPSKTSGAWKRGHDLAHEMQTAGELAGLEGTISLWGTEHTGVSAAPFIERPETVSGIVNSR